MKLDKNKMVKKVFFLAVVVALFFAAIVQVSSDVNEKVKYSDMEKEEIEDDDESQEALREYYGELLGYVKKNAKFNTIATKDSLAVLNVTINGKDRRILTRLKTGTLFPAQQDLLNATLIRTMNLVVLGNISLKGNLFFDAEESFGLRRFYGIGSTDFRYIDEGFARLVNGKANVSINPVLGELISSYNVFLSAEGLTRGIYIAEKTSSYFVVKSVNAESNVGFSWMLRGVKKEEEKLSSEYGKEKGISITAEIDFENGRSEITINGLDKIFALIANETVNETIINETVDETAVNETIISETVNETNQTDQGITLITGNLIDEFGLETDLGQILGEAATLPNLTDETTTSETISNETITNITEETVTNETVEGILGNITSNETVEVNETVVPEISILEFTLYSTNEDFIVSQVADVTGLNLGEVRKLINFVYAEPEGFEDEVIEEPVVTSLDFIEKVNGSVIIRLG